MRVLMVSKACLVGAYQSKLEEIARRDEVELMVVTPPDWRGVEGVTRLERAHTQGYELIVEPIAFNGRFHLHFYPRLARRIRAFRPDVVHVDEEPYNLATAHAIALARQAGCRTLWFTWQNLLRRYPPPFSLFERYCLRRADAAIAGSHTAARVWREKGYGGPLAVIPQFGVDPQVFAPSDRRASGREMVVGFAGRLVKEKGVDVLLDAVAGLPGVRVEILALGSEGLREQLAAQAEQLGIAGRVVFHSALPSTRMPEFYARLDALVLPSRSQPNWAEQFGRVLIEAMACGTPVVGSTCGEIPHVIGDAGLVFAEGDAQALRAQLTRLLGDSELRADLARRGREHVLAHYTQAQVAEQTVAFYRAMMTR